MSRKIDAREVLSYLNELGFQNIDAQQLKEFIKDLKKLMKYEERCSKELSKQSTINSSSSCQNNETSSFSSHSSRNSSTSSESDDISDVFTNLYKQHTIASQLKKTNKKESVISVQIRKPPHKILKHEHCVHCDNTENNTNSQVTESYANGDNELKHNSFASDYNKIDFSNRETDAVDAPLENLDSRAARVIKCKNYLKPKVSFIRPRSARNILKTDPVSLYHYYQNEWKKQKIPGEDNRSDLRWAIRERMLGDPKTLQPYASLEKLGRKRSSSCSRAY